jgi:plasmid maintenance system antidote protein VapI
MVLAEVRRRSHNMKEPTPNKARVLAAFIRARLDELNMSDQAFAQLLDMDQELADSIINGVLPSSEISDELLTEIAAALGCRKADLLHLIETNPGPTTSES